MLDRGFIERIPWASVPSVSSCSNACFEHEQTERTEENRRWFEEALLVLRLGVRQPQPPGETSCEPHALTGCRVGVFRLEFCPSARLNGLHPAGHERTAIQTRRCDNDHDARRKDHQGRSLRGSALRVPQGGLPHSKAPRKLQGAGTGNHCRMRKDLEASFAVPLAYSAEPSAVASIALRTAGLMRESGKRKTE